ncbi:YdcF family protein [Aerosakkonema funiforme]|uniref:YdcF family protein n=1 Tax=Aerosakkonema funiforme TaxID=1246630 RepID=UPI0035BB2DB0
MQPKISIRRNLLRLIRNRFVLLGLSGLCLILGIWLINIGIILQKASQGPVDAFLVLGGSITREIYVAELAKKYPQTPILISGGSKDPCILLIFRRANAPMQNVLLEKCAKTTFGNFYFSQPILSQWQVHKVKLITSLTHLPRAKWLAQIILGSHGIWVEPDIVKEQGIPGNRESFLLTAWGLTRSLSWAVISQFYSPKCSELTKLTEVNLKAWQAQGFTVKRQCERQANLQEIL